MSVVTAAEIALVIAAQSGDGSGKRSIYHHAGWRRADSALRPPTARLSAGGTFGVCRGSEIGCGSRQRFDWRSPSSWSSRPAC